MSIQIEQGKLYEITCPECGHEMYCCASHHQMTGQPETGNMVAKDYVIYIDESTNKH